MKMKRYIPFLFVIVFLVLGILFMINQETNNYYTIYSSSRRILYLKNNSYFKFFTSSTISIENSILYSLLLIIGKNNLLDSFIIYNYIISMILYIMIIFFSFSKNSNVVVRILLSFLGCIVAFLGPYGDAIETKLILIGGGVFYLIQDIKNRRIKLVAEVLILFFFYSILYPIIYLMRLLHKKNVDNICMVILSVLLGGLLIRIYSFGFAYDSLFEAFYSAFIYNPWVFESNALFAGGIVLGIIFLSLLLICFQQNKIKRFWIGIYVFVLIYVLTTTSSDMALIASLRIYIAVAIMLYFAIYQMIDNIFDLRNIIYIATLCIVFIGVGTVITYNDSKEDFAYRINYDYSYSISKKKKDERTGISYSNMYEFFTKLDMIPECQLISSEMNTAFTQGDSVLYGYSVVQDIVGSRWASNMSAVQLYCTNGDNLVVSMYNPENRIGIEYDIVIDNEIKYQGVTEFGTQSVELPLDVSTGEHIIKLVIHVPDNQKFGIYITSIQVVE